MGWYGGGENASRERRVELRKVAMTRIEAIGTRARAEINRASAEMQTELLTIGMSSEAKALLDRMPSASALMPPLVVEEIETLLIERRSAP
jgi:hypothetical protein